MCEHLTFRGQRGRWYSFLVLSDGTKVYPPLSLRSIYFQLILVSMSSHHVSMLPQRFIRIRLSHSYLTWLIHTF